MILHQKADREDAIRKEIWRRTVGRRRKEMAFNVMIILAFTSTIASIVYLTLP